MINCAVLMGRMVGDPELKTTPSGTSVTSFRIAVDRIGKDKAADFIDIVAWRQTAEFVTRYFHKGSMIAVQGSIQARNYEDKNGNKRTAFEVVANNVSFCGKEQTKAVDLEPVCNIDTATPQDFETIDDDDLPF
ncbi:MAG: single-stranded DNA-binding protein [Prevotella sp.]|nr:single-stranded DNA-binding protein [Prevotella sp.]